MKVLMLSPKVLWGAVLLGAVVLAGCNKNPDSPYSANAVEQTKEFAKKQSDLANAAALAKHPLSQVKVDIESGQPDLIQGKTTAAIQPTKK